MIGTRVAAAVTVTVTLSLLVAVAGGCTGNVESQDASTQRETGSDSDSSDSIAPPREAGAFAPGDPCPSGSCGSASDLICYSGACRRICQSQCGDPAAECASDEGCYTITSFSSACLPTSGGQAGDSCDGPSCAPGLLCVEWGGAPPRCLARCAGGAKCASGFRCDKTNQGCEVCHP